MEDHEHRFYMQPKTYTEFVPATFTLNDDMDGIMYITEFIDSLPDFYVRREWAILSCNCGVVKRVLVKDA